MPRTCFVIMPFSSTESCSEEEWTLIFEALFKPAVESAGLDYECHRSVATRGNIVSLILQALDEAYVVLADLTDQNANVFYELGVRHSLKDRTILVAQKNDDIPFDLRAYAYHIYDLQTEHGKRVFATRITELLSEIDSNPDRPDNPVSDFLGRNIEPTSATPPTTISPQEVTYAQSLAGPSAEGLDASDFARRIARQGPPQAVKTILRITRSELRGLMRESVDELNQRQAPQSITRDQIPIIAREYIDVAEPLVQKIEQFILTSVEEEWTAGMGIGLHLAGDWISLSELRPAGHTIRFAQGTPALLAWRLLILSGTKALNEEAYNLLGVILRESIEVESSSGRFSNLPLIKRRDLFYPEAFLGYADYPIKYMAGLWNNHNHLHSFFESEENYQFALAKFLILLAIAFQPDEEGRPLYPGYRLVSQSSRAMSSFVSRLASSGAYLEGIAQAIGETGAHFREAWSERVQRINSVALGSSYIDDGPHFPVSLVAEPPE